ncbi:MAG: preprotein translocase subunit SecE [Planctomycetota bacterium]|nr:preprotein translocase subunit SecE [Planctomycetota bacterium]
MLQLYRSGQGKWARLVAAGGSMALVIFGCWTLYNYLMGFPSLRKLEIGTIPGVEVVVNLPFLVAAVLFCTLGLFIYYFLGHHKKVCDFLIETELEIKKVSWPSGSEVLGSSLIVIVAVVVFSLFAMLCDVVIAFVMRFFYVRGGG